MQERKSGNRDLDEGARSVDEIPRNVKATVLKMRSSVVQVQVTHSPPVQVSESRLE